MTPTDTSRINVLPTLLTFFKENDQHIFNQIELNVKKSIKASAKVQRTVTTEIFLEVCMLPEVERLIKIKTIKNKELLDYYCYENDQVSASDRKFLEQFTSLKEGFKQLYGDDEKRYEKAELYLAKQKKILKSTIESAEQRRSEYLGLPAGGSKTRKHILDTLRETPFGSEILLYDVMLDLCHNYLNYGKIGDPINMTCFHKTGSPIIQQFNHPSLQNI